MTTPRAQWIIDEYMTRMEGALAQVPNARRQELLDEVRTHIAEARSQLPNETEADLLNILDRLGDPAETAAAELGRNEPTPEHRRSSHALEIVTIVLLPLFWPVGVVLLWISNSWTRRDKLIGTFVAPGGYLGTLVVGSLLTLGAIAPLCQTVSDDSGRILSSTCPSGGSQIAIDFGAALVLILYVVGPILTAAYLARRLQSRRRGLELATHSDVAPAL